MKAQAYRIIPSIYICIAAERFPLFIPAALTAVVAEPFSLFSVRRIRPRLNDSIEVMTWECLSHDTSVCSVV